MLSKFKKSLYFAVAGYFRFFAAIQLKIWHPTIIVVTGSNGKTTTLHLLESQLQKTARYSHFANSAFGISFDVLDINRTSFTRAEWLRLFAMAPIKALEKPYPESIYVAEADCDRPNEGAFLAKLLKPDTTIWLSSARTHSLNFDKLITQGKFSSVDEAIAYEYGHHIEHTTGTVIVNADNDLIMKQLSRSKAKQILIRDNQLDKYSVGLDGSSFKIDGTEYILPFLLPEVNFYSIAAVLEVNKKYDVKTDTQFSKLILPPGRSSVFKGIHGATIIDSSYNANYTSVEAILSMVSQVDSDKKWLILGDLLELGAEEAEEYDKVTKLLNNSDFKRIILVGPRLNKRILPKLISNPPKGCEMKGFIETREARDYIKQSISGDELLVFKGARYLESIIEELLADKSDASKLCRRQEHFSKKRKGWSL